MSRWRHRKTRDRGERGASLPEYALLLAGMAVGVLLAVETATDHTRDSIESGHEVTAGDSATFGTGSTTSSSTTAPGSSTTFPTIPPTTTSTTTAPTTTLPGSTTTSTTSTTLPGSTTTTTAGPTTTTAPTTTTTEAQNHVTVISATSSLDSGGPKWTASFLVQVTRGGAPQSGVVVTGSILAGSATTTTCNTNSSGQCVLHRSNILSSRSTAVLTVTGVSSPWDGVTATSTVAKP